MPRPFLGIFVRITEPYELSSESPLRPVYVRAEAYLHAKQWEPAAAEYQKILHHRGLVGNSPVGALAHLGLARTYAGSGDITKARTEYQDFFGLWKDADPGMPVFQQAKVEYSRGTCKIRSLWIKQNCKKVF